MPNLANSLCVTRHRPANVFLMTILAAPTYEVRKNVNLRGVGITVPPFKTYHIKRGRFFVHLLHQISLLSSIKTSPLAKMKAPSSQVGTSRASWEGASWTETGAQTPYAAY